jgi:purine-binding chemotaxis protein CheW
MARRGQQAIPNDDAQRVDTESIAAFDGGAAAEEHLVAFRLADDLFAFRLKDISEIIRLPNLAHMPLGPKSLLGLANLRGVVLPVVATRRLLGLPEAALRSDLSSTA